MFRTKRGKSGFSHILLALALVLVGLVVAGVGIKVHKANKHSSNSAINTGSCVKNPNAMFTHDFTEPDKLRLIEPPVITDSNIRDRAWPAIDTTKTDKVAIYAPAEVELTSGIHKVEKLGHTQTDYDLWFELSCTRWFFINHVSDPVQKIRNLLPGPALTQASNGTSATAAQTPFKPAVHFTSGELIGYTTGTSGAHNFDLGVFDDNHQNVMPASYTGGPSGRENHAICSFDLFPSIIKAKYYEILKNSPIEAGSLCPQ